MNRVKAILNGNGLTKGEKYTIIETKQNIVYDWLITNVVVKNDNNEEEEYILYGDVKPVINDDMPLYEELMDYYEESAKEQPKKLVVC